MECTWDSRLLMTLQADELPAELLEFDTDKQFLDSLTRAALHPELTSVLLGCFEDVLAHVCASLCRHGKFATTIATLGRIVPYASFLSPFATSLLESETYNWSHEDNDDNELMMYLLGIFRLLRFDRHRYCRYVPVSELTVQLDSTTPSARYLIIRILQVYLDGADAWFEAMVARYIGEDSPTGTINGLWDEKVIDYRFLTLWEDDRQDSILKEVHKIKNTPENHENAALKSKVLSAQSFDPSVCLIGGLLLPRKRNGPTSTSSDLSSRIITTATVVRNLQSIAQSLKSSNSVLLSGPAGSGKSLLIRHVALQVGTLADMVTLHLNEQSDAKLLLGIYTTGDTPGSFVWKPGVLTTAVQEGRWVLIEDLDRAPNEVLGVLLPLIESRELYLPSRKETIVAAEGFRLFATVRTFTNHRREEVSPITQMLGQRHWRSVHLSVPPVNELGTIIRGLYPGLEQASTQLMAVYERLLATQTMLVSQSKTGVARSINARDFMKWCKRVSLNLQQRRTFDSHDIDNIFLEAVDCFVSAMPPGNARTGLVATLAEELRVDPQRRDHLIAFRAVRYELEKTQLNIGRFNLPRKQTQRHTSAFSTNSHTTRMLERVTAAAMNREPLLLVGETGVGKTTAVQHLANHLGKKLVPFNLSQQSEAGDLLGGFKPVNSRSLLVPLKNEFDQLFTESFSSNDDNNRLFLDRLNKHMTRSKWKSVCHLFRKALDMVDKQRSVSPARDGEAPSKKRKVDTKRSIDFTRWESFADNLNAIEQRVGADDDFAFAFVEGNIVKAVRNGDWVLLDEINLASSDTLESLTDLLDQESPSLLLTEAGNIERINAHPEFRVFAAMNPATDVGKKDLPPGIRSRFTEVYVESPDKDAKCLQSIVQAYLPQESLSNPSLPSDVTAVYQTITCLADENKLVDGAGQRPHFSLRTLTRTLSYAKRIQQMCNIRRALYEGFQMGFMTFLDDESARLVEPVIEKYLFGKRTNIHAELKRALRKPTDGHEYVQGHPKSKHWIRKGVLAVEDQPQYIITPFVEKNLENLVRAASTRQFPVLIQGPTSSGKTSMIEYLAKRTGHRFVRINNHEHTDLQEYLGTYVSGSDGHLQFQEGVLVKALREGHWVVLDELNLAPTDVLEALNRLLDDNRELLVPETQEVVRPHAEFMLFATQNPAGLYGGRKPLSRAFRNRFLELHFDDIPVHELQEILHRRTQLPESRSKRIVNVYKELSVLRQETRLFEQKSFATLRDLFRWALRPNDTIQQLAQNGYMLLCERVRKDEERLALKAVIEKVMSAGGPRVLIDETALYSQESPEIQRFIRNADEREVVWTSAMRRLYVLVSHAIQNNEPVLLVGETGCGKTTVCQMIARALKKDLHMLNAHQNTETGDIIGSQRPVRNRASIESELRTQLLGSTLLQASSDTVNASIDSLLKTYDQAFSVMDNEQKQEYLQGAVHSNILSLRTRFQALFEWVDGSLVHAMRNGDFFLLDEISLADDSVLERLNSVLEPSRTILLAEKGSLDSSVTAAPGFQFFATMNPGGDYGKRELSPALRNRFTEIWVPALSGETDILQIVRARLIPAAQAYAHAMVAFANWFKARFDTSANSAVSIRDTLAWVQFVNLFAQHDVEASIVHGAAMVYIDTLGANPAGLMTLSMHNLDSERRTCLKELGRFLQMDAQAVNDTPIEVTTTATKFTVGPFSLVRNSDVLDDVGFSFKPLATRLNAMRVLRALQLSKPVMLEGSPGVGKTALVTAVAQAIGMPLTRINLSDQTDLLDLFGSDTPVEGEQTGSFIWRDAPFLRAMKRGEWVLLDEMNLASQSVLEGLNACLDHRGEVFVPELGQTFSRNPGFRLFAAQNPHHQGGGRKGLPASFVNRFTVVYADAFGDQDLKLICERRFSSATPSDIAKAVAFVTKLSNDVSENRKYGSNGAPWEFNLRDISRWLDLAMSSDGLLRAGTAQDFVDALFARRFRTASDRSCVKELFGSIFESELTAGDLSISKSPQVLQIGLGVLSRDPLRASPVKGKMMLSTPLDHLFAAQSIMFCIRKGWPVVLSGPAGAGKTALIEQLAATTGASVRTLSMNAETDSMDLIGGYEQYDPRRSTAQAILALQEDAFREAKFALLGENALQAIDLLRSISQARFELSPENLARLSKALATFESSHKDESAQLTRPLQQIDKARFEWVDGPLIDAIRQGHWLVLDNANLCSPSVLDRLNSLLEPNGVLLLNEHAGPDGAPKVLRPHPNFRVFLTIDPRLGELSRAMRNRAVELHLFTDEASSNKPMTNPFATESTMARFSAIKVLSANNLKTQRDSRSLVAVIRDHFALRDEALVPRLLQQMKLGLYRETIGIPLDECHKLMTQLAPLPDTLRQLETFYRQCQLNLEVPADYANVQTLYPLNNQPLALQSEQDFSRAKALATFLDLKSSLIPLAREISTSNSDRQSLQCLDRFLRATQENSTGNRASTFMKTLQSMLQLILSWSQDILNSNADILVMSHLQLSSLISYFRFFHASTSTGEPDPAIFSACLALGRSLCQDDNSDLLKDLSTQLLSTFSRIQPEIAHSTGYAYVPFWRALRPSTPRSFEHLQTIMKFEDVVKQFDNATSKHALPLQSTVDLRSSFQQALSIINTTPDGLDAVITQASTAISSTDPHGGPEKPAMRPHFANSFELICQQMALLSLGRHSFKPLEPVLLELLAGRGTQESMSYSRGDEIGSPQRIFQLLHLTELHNEEQTIFPNTLLGTSLLKDLSSISKVTLNNLDLLEDEVTYLGHCIASQAHVVLQDTRPELDHALISLMRTILSIMSGVEELGSLSDISKGLLNLIDGRPSSEPSNLLALIHSSEFDRRFRPIAARLLETAKKLSSNSPLRMTTLEDANAWTSFAITCLELFAPEAPSDPVVQAQVQHSIQEQIRSDLESKLAAVETFSRIWVGDHDTLRTRTLKTQLNALGPQPTAVQICRPPKSQLLGLLAEFRGLMRVLQPVRDADPSQDLSKALDTVSWDNVEIIRSRLAGTYRSYADITTPVTGFVDCLAIARRLSYQAKFESSTKTGASYLSKITPLRDSELDGWFSDELCVQSFERCTSQKEYLYWLSVLAVRSSVLPIPQTSAALQAAISTGFDRFYEAWRRELTHDQRAAAAKSSLYKYRGGAEVEDEVDIEELEALFPGFENVSSSSKQNGEYASHSQNLAPDLARLYHSLHSATSIDHNQLLEILEHYNELVTATETQENQVSDATMLLLGTAKLKSSLHSRAASHPSVNVYKNSNIEESKRLVLAVKKVSHRFNTIHDAWPDHAVPIDILRICDQILEQPHSEPLMKYLPFVEKLHSAINEWQKVASSEYSASTMLEEIINIIVSWRQLELSTWAALFDQEDKQCVKSSASWWYVAYETIIMASNELRESSGLLESFAQELTGTLGNFLINCGHGEFKTRLQMLRDFQSDLMTRSQVFVNLSTIHHALASVVAYYSHFEQSIEEALSRRRADLGKEVRNVIQLASWKDRNIETLKSSSKSSHKKLFKIVRKYRQVLSQPVGDIFHGDFPQMQEHVAVTPAQTEQLSSSSSVTPKTDLSTLQLWRQRPTETANPQSSAEDILTKMEVFRTTGLGTIKIQDFLTELEKESTELRKATPGTSTEENKTLIQHLKTRKRRLLADVLKDVRVMGFQVNLSEDVLAQQREISAVLAANPLLGSIIDSHNAAAADYEFLRLLHVIPGMRDAAAKPSDDLTPAEVARCKILIESMLRVSLEQRKTLARRFRVITNFRVTLDLLRSFATSQSPFAMKPSDRAVRTLQARVFMTLNVVKVLVECINIQAEFSQRDYSTVLDSLKNEVEYLVNVKGGLDALRILPNNVADGDHRAIAEQYDVLGSRLERLVERSVVTHPELGPTLSHLRQWSGKLDGHTGHAIARPSQHPSNPWIHALLVAASAIPTLVANGANALNVPKDIKASKAWLLEEQKFQDKAFSELGVEKTSEQLQSLLQQLGGGNDDTTLAQLSAVSNALYPMFQAYGTVLDEMVSNACTCSASLSRMAYQLALSFTQLARRGFCTPSEKDNKEEQQSGDVETGTGLGDGEGGEDISKDIGANEDLSELAQEANKDDKDQEMQAEKDAVDMADEDLEGEFDEGGGDEEDGEGDEKDAESNAELDEEAGQVGEDDAGAVDEKMWDGGEAEQNQEKDAQNAKGEKSKDVAAAEDQKPNGEETGDDAELEELEDDAADDIDGDSQTDQGGRENEQMDPHADMEDNLDLPEDMVMDGEKGSLPDDDISDNGTNFGDDIEENAVPDDSKEEASLGEQGDTEDHDLNEGKEPSEPEQNEDEAGEDMNSDIAMLDGDDGQQDLNDGLVSGEDGTGQEQNTQKADSRPSVAADMQREDEESKDAGAGDGTEGGATRTEDKSTSNQADQTGEEQQMSNLKQQLGDILKQYYEQQREIQPAVEREGDDSKDAEDMDVTNAQFEHVPENTDTEMQALGAASTEQSRALNKDNSIPVNDTEPEDLPMPIDSPAENDQPDDDQESISSVPHEQVSEADAKMSKSKAMIGTYTDVEMADVEQGDNSEEDTDLDDLTAVDQRLTETHISQEETLSHEEARQLWAEHEGRTRNMAIVLTEHLRLILQPTQATKMRGDFRTGKRLNIKKIIPYIASSYKRDKIWMRRSVPSKRSYQIMLAIDDSKSMTESDSKSLAFDTLSLVAKSMAMLEVGEVCVVGFGENVNIAHDFSMPFTSEAGAEVVRQFSFAQTKTDVRKLLETSIETFRAARTRASGPGNLWQLQLIISDGVCEDHPSIRQLVRQAHEEQIMVVFIIIDSTAPNTNAPTEGPRQSILDLQTAGFTKNADGEPIVTLVKYLDTFPFRYYLIVRDVQELPGVLAGALRQWFSEVVETGNS